jgi:hypothetical protein
MEREGRGALSFSLCRSSQAPAATAATAAVHMIAAPREATTEVAGAGSPGPGPHLVREHRAADGQDERKQHVHGGTGPSAQAVHAHEEVEYGPAEHRGHQRGGAGQGDRHAQPGQPGGPPPEPGDQRPGLLGAAVAVLMFVDPLRHHLVHPVHLVCAEAVGAQEG